MFSLPLSLSSLTLYRQHTCIYFVNKRHLLDNNLNYPLSEPPGPTENRQVHRFKWWQRESSVQAYTFLQWGFFNPGLQEESIWVAGGLRN